MSDIRASFYDGQSSQRHLVHLSWGEQGVLSLRGEGIQRDYPCSDIQKTSRLGKVVRLIDFIDGGRLESDACVELDTYLDQFQLGQREGLIHKLEHSLKYIAVAVVVTMLTAWGFVVYGIPVMAERIAYVLPADIQNDLGDGVLESLDSYVFEPSTLSETRQQGIREWFTRLASQVEDRDRLTLEFRASPLLGANALALPSGTIVVTDGLVELSQHDEEVASVLAHEIGHIQYRHSLRGAIQNSGVALVIALMLGDASAISSFAVALPTVMVNMKYSRNFESEADDFARELMLQYNIPLHRFADILSRMGESKKVVDRETSFFDSHPAIQERIEQFLPARQ